MNVQDIRQHRWGTQDFYNNLHATTIAEASKEPLKIGDLEDIKKNGALPSGKIVTYKVGVCYQCVNHLLSFYNRKRALSEQEKEYIAERISEHYRNWSVLDLPTFVQMAVDSRLPTTRLGETEYELVYIDIPNIMGKLGSYDNMRPNTLALQGNSPAKALSLQPIRPEHYDMLLDGTPYDFSVPYEDYVQGYSAPSGSPTVNAERYWRGTPHNGDEDFERFYANYRAKLISQDIVQPVNRVLGLL